MKQQVLLHNHALKQTTLDKRSAMYVLAHTNFFLQLLKVQTLKADYGCTVTGFR